MASSEERLTSDDTFDEREFKQMTDSSRPCGGIGRNTLQAYQSAFPGIGMTSDQRQPSVSKRLHLSETVEEHQPFRLPCRSLCLTAENACKDD